MSAGTAYTKRFGGGFIDLPTTTTPIDAAFLNAVETALVQILGVAPTADGQIPVWVDASTRFGYAKLLNANVDPAAAIAYSKLNLAGGIVNADINAAAGIAYSKLALTNQVTNADIAGGAAVALSKIAVGGNVAQVVKGDGSVALPGTYRKSSTKTVNTTVAATDLLNGEITVGANLMGASGVLRLTAWGDWKQNSGGTAAPPRWQLLFGGTTVFDTGTSGTVVTNLATRLSWRVVFELMNEGTGFQTASCHGFVQAPTTTAGSTLFTTGEGTYATFFTSSAGIGIFNGMNTVSVDTTAAKTLVLNVINGSASASYETVLQSALVEVI